MIQEILLAVVLSTSFIQSEPLDLLPDDVRVAVIEEVASDTIEEFKDDPDSGLYIMAHVIHGEAGSLSCSTDMRYYVGSVVINRVRSDIFPNTIHDVVYQSGQYGCVWDGHYDLEPTEECWDIAYDILYNDSHLPTYVLFQSNEPQGSGVYLKEQNMYFCYK